MNCEIGQKVTLSYIDDNTKIIHWESVREEPSCACHVRSTMYDKDNGIIYTEFSLRRNSIQFNPIQVYRRTIFHLTWFIWSAWCRVASSSSMIVIRNGHCGCLIHGTLVFVAWFVVWRIFNPIKQKGVIRIISILRCFMTLSLCDRYNMECER